jgi:hypothetical protein
VSFLVRRQRPKAWSLALPCCRRCTAPCTAHSGRARFGRTGRTARLAGPDSDLPDDGDRDERRWPTIASRTAFRIRPPSSMTSWRHARRSTSPGLPAAATWNSPIRSHRAARASTDTSARLRVRRPKCRSIGLRADGEAAGWAYSHETSLDPRNAAISGSPARSSMPVLPSQPFGGHVALMT